MPKNFEYKMFFTLFFTCLASSVIIVGTHFITKERIANNQVEYLLKQVRFVLPHSKALKPFSWSEGKFHLEEDLTSDQVVLFVGYEKNNDQLPNGYALKAEVQGFADKIQVLYAYDKDKQVINGFKVLSSKETPGLGDKIEKDEEFLSHFYALDVRLDEQKKSLVNQIEVVKAGKKQHSWQISTITGATVSSQAIGELIQSHAAQFLPIIYQQFGGVSNDEESVDRD